MEIILEPLYCNQWDIDIIWDIPPLVTLGSTPPPRRRGGCRRKGAQLPGAARLERGARGAAGLEATGGPSELGWWVVMSNDLIIINGRSSGS